MYKVRGRHALCRIGKKKRTISCWIGLDWIGLDWIGLDWIGLDWIGLDWIGVKLSTSRRVREGLNGKVESLEVFDDRLSHLLLLGDERFVCVVAAGRQRQGLASRNGP